MTWACSASVFLGSALSPASFGLLCLHSDNNKNTNCCFQLYFLSGFFFGIFSPSENFMQCILTVLSSFSQLLHIQLCVLLRNIKSRILLGIWSSTRGKLVCWKTHLPEPIRQAPRSSPLFRLGLCLDCTSPVHAVTCCPSCSELICATILLCLEETAVIQ